MPVAVMKARTEVNPCCCATGHSGPSAGRPALRRHMLHRQPSTPPTQSGQRQVPLSLAAAASTPSLFAKQLTHHCSGQAVHTAFSFDVVCRQQWHAEYAISCARARKVFERSDAC